MKLHSFDAEYVRQLKTGDPGAENHFVSYFSALLYLKLTARLRSHQMIEDVRQETLLRVLEAVRKKNGLEHPERFGAFVNAVCNHVLLEFWRAESRQSPGNYGMEEPADLKVDLDGPLVDSDRKRQVHRVLDELTPKDRRLLRAVYLEELDRAEICRRHGVDAGYLRVLLHRAKSRFRKIYQEQDCDWQLPAARAGIKVQIHGVHRQVHAHHVTHLDAHAIR